MIYPHDDGGGLSPSRGPGSAPHRRAQDPTATETADRGAQIGSPTVLVKLHGVDLPGTRFGDRHGVRVGLRVKHEIQCLVSADVDDAFWETEIRVRQLTPGYDYTGPAVRGRRDERFLSLAWLDQTDELFRALKIRLDQLPTDLVSEAQSSDATLSAMVRLTDDRGEPLCATAPQSHLIWTLEADA